MADVGVYTDGSGRVFGWQDQSGRGGNVTQPTAAFQPTLIASRFNNLPGVRFDGIDDFLAAAGILATDDFTVFVIAAPSTTIRIDGQGNSGTGGMTGQYYLLGADNPGGDNSGACVSLGINGVAAYDYGNGYMPALAVYSGSIGTSCPLVVRYTSKTPVIYLCGLEVADGLTSPMSNVYPPNRIGGCDYGAFAGDIAEILLYNRAVGDDERASVESYLQAKYACLPTPTPTAQPTPTQTPRPTPTPTATPRPTPTPTATPRPTPTPTPRPTPAPSPHPTPTPSPRPTPTPTPGPTPTPTPQPPPPTPTGTPTNALSLDFPDIIPIYRSAEEGGTELEEALTISLSGPPGTVQVEIATDSGTGAATFSDGSTSQSVYVDGSATLNVRGTENSDMKDNITITATLSDGGEEAVNVRARAVLPAAGQPVTANKKFATRTQPEFSDALFIQYPFPGAIKMQFLWKSESGVIGDVDKMIMIGEIVTYAPNINPALPSPPYQAAGRPSNPTVVAGPTPNTVHPPTQNGYIEDIHTYPGGTKVPPDPGFLKPYSATTSTATQKFGFWDTAITGAINYANPTVGFVLLTQRTIVRTITQNSNAFTFTVSEQINPGEPTRSSSKNLP